MKAFVVMLCMVPLFSFLACAKKSTFHKGPMPDPKSFDAHFGDIDTGDDDLVSWDEFKAYFPHAEPNVFEAIDLNKNNALDHGEWHQFKAAHGMKHHE